MTVAETVALGNWVIVGPNPTKAPQGIARVTAITENGGLIVASGHMQDKHLVPAACCTPHAGPPPGREPAPLARAGEAPPENPLEALVAQAASKPAVEPPRRASTLWHIGDRVEITRALPGNPPVGTVGHIFGSAAIHGYYRVKTDDGVIVVDGGDLAPHIPAGPNRGEREAAERAAQPQPQPSRLKTALAERRKEDAQMSPRGGLGKPRGPRSEAHSRAIAEGKARGKAEREARTQLDDVKVEVLEERDGEPVTPPPPLRLVEPPVADSPAPPAATVPLDPPRDGAGVDDALRWAIGQGAQQRLSVVALRLMVDTLEVVEREVRR